MRDTLKAILTGVIWGLAGSAIIMATSPTVCQQALK